MERENRRGEKKACSGFLQEIPISLDYNTAKNNGQIYQKRSRKREGKSNLAASNPRGTIAQKMLVNRINK